MGNLGGLARLVLAVLWSRGRQRYHTVMHKITMKCGLCGLVCFMVILSLNLKPCSHTCEFGLLDIQQAASIHQIPDTDLKLQLHV